MPKTVTKITALKALLGDEAAKRVVEEAEIREKAAKAAGVEFKDANDKPVPLSKLLAEIDEAIANGAVVDDVNTDEDETEIEAEAPQAKELGFTLDQFKSAVTEIVDAKLTAFKAELEKAAPKTETDKAKEQEATKLKEAEDLKIKLKTMEDEAKVVKDKLAELLGEQPRNAGFRASRSAETVKETVHSSPGPDPLNQFIDDVVFGVAKRGVNGA